ncbi:hypothetical protein IW261DRAFT_1490589 [Armillaria novae-zelandiae]|uniref:F-box domain-containing protein n=1 Tax=Armillaria novae-zelandiae TaxID=153914 RepID=A0AA39U3Q2_9AGAR|nr:hypothetical protein IW261DRAFT_1490589 [Armillaria novae-zelandiae]
MMYPQELIDKILDYLHDSPPVLKECSLVSHQFYPRTRVHLFRYVNCDNPLSLRLFGITHSPELLQCIKRVQFRCCDFFYSSTAEFLHSLPSSVTLCIWNDRVYVSHPIEKCEWRHFLPPFMSSAPYLAITRLELQDPRWNTFIEFHRIVLSLPNVTELHISGLTELNTNNMPVVPASAAPRIKKMSFHISWSTALMFWDGLCLYQSTYLDHLEELHIIKLPLDGLRAVVQTANLASSHLRVLEIDCVWYFTDSLLDISHLDLNPDTELRVGIELNDDMLPVIRWWIKCFKTVEKESTLMERLTIKLAGRGHYVTPEQLEPLKNALEELNDVLSQLVRNVDLVLQLKKYHDTHSGLCTDCLRGAIIDACQPMKEKANFRVFDMAEHTYDVPVFPPIYPC